MNKKQGKPLKMRLFFFLVTHIDGKPAQPDAAPEEIKAEVHRAIDTYAPYGSYIFFGFKLVDSMEPGEIMKAMMPIFDEAAKYGKTFYQ